MTGQVLRYTRERPDRSRLWRRRSLIVDAEPLPPAFAVLATHRLMRGGARHEYQTAHVWRIRDGMFTAWRGYPRDLQVFDRVWS